MMRFFLTGVLLSLALMACGQKTVTVTARYSYHAPGDVPPAQARQTAIERAQTDAIAAEFGTCVSSSNFSFITTGAGAEDRTEFRAFGESDVRGEWIETLGDTVFTITPTGGDLIYNVKLKGRIRELTGNRIELDTRLLFNGCDKDRDGLRNFTYHAGDYMYLYFRSPVDGYLAVYLGDDDVEHTMQCLLPYRGQHEGAYRIEADRDYVFFSRDYAEDDMRSMVSRLKMNSHTRRDVNQLYVIFSPNPFAKAPDADSTRPGSRAVDMKGNALELLPLQLGFGAFQKWLARNRRKDPDMQVGKTIFVVEKN